MSTATSSNAASSLPSTLGNNANSKEVPALMPLTRPRIIIPSKALALAPPPTEQLPTEKKTTKMTQQKSVPVITPKEPSPVSLTSVTTPSSSRQTASSEKEKIGRWSEEEHKVFLEGLGKHGKQWKIIAGMIGTRTVVQVRTHAQKYFQRMERAQSGGTVGGAIKPSSSPKRKMSLPASLPSRSKKAKTSSSSKKTLSRAASLSLVSNTSSPPHEL